MSHRNGTVDRITRPAYSAGHRPAIYGSRLGYTIDNRPRFTWLEAERMRDDPQVQFGLRILEAPLYGLQWKVTADSDRLGRWIDRELTRAYRRILPRVGIAHEYGASGGELVFQARRVAGRTEIHFKDFEELHPRHAKPLVWERGPRKGKLAGLAVNDSQSGRGTIYLDKLHSFWFRGEARFGEWWGRPRLAGAFEPWLEKRGRHGAISARQLFYKKCFRGPMLRHPAGYTDFGDENSSHLISNQDIARELGEKFESGGVLAFINTVDQKTGKYLWEWEDPKSFGDVAGILEYPRQLDKEILDGLGIPKELLEASTTGSGFSGRAIPAQMFFCSLDKWAAVLVEAIDRQILRPLVRMNFGPVGYEISLVPLAKGMEKPDQPPAPPMQPQPAAADPHRPVEGDGPRGGHGIIDPSTGKIIRYTHPGGSVRMSLRAQSARRESRAARELWDRCDGPTLMPQALRLSQGFDETKIVRETTAHDGKRPGEFAKKGEAGGGDAEEEEPAGARPERGSARRAKAVLAAAKSIPIKDAVIVGDAIARGDADGIESQLTDEEKGEMESALANWRDDWLDEQMQEFEPDIDEDDIARDAGWDDEGVRDAVVEAFGGIDWSEIDESDGDADYWQEKADDWYSDTRKHGLDAFDQLAESLEDDGAPAQVLDAVRSVRSRAEDSIETAVKKANESAESDERERLSDKYDDGEDRTEWLRQFHRDHEDEPRFSGAAEEGVWGRDSFNDWVYKFSTSSGSQYTIDYWTDDFAGQSVPTISFKDASQSFSVTGAGDAHEVFSAVTAASVAIVQRESPPVVTFTAAEASRQKLYRRLVKTIAAVMPEYAAIALSGDPERYIVLKRDRLKDVSKYLPAGTPPPTTLVD